MVTKHITDIVYDWDPEKNEKLIIERGVSFEQVVAILENGSILGVIQHPNQQAYDHQKIYLIEINDYVHMVPFVKEGNRVFLKTIFRSRKMTKKYLK